MMNFILLAIVALMLSTIVLSQDTVPTMKDLDLLKDPIASSVAASDPLVVPASDVAADVPADAVSPAGATALLSTGLATVATASALEPPDAGE